MAGKARDLRAAAELKAPTPAARRAPSQTGEWRPGYELDGDDGTVTTDAIPDGGDVDWDAIFRHWNLDPARWSVVDGTLRVNAWEGPTTDGARVRPGPRPARRPPGPTARPAAVR